MIDYERRFSSVNRLYQEKALPILANSYVVVVGIGGVGSWATEAIARAGIGNILLIDLDVIAESNINRQIHAMTSTLGASKCEIMRDRIYEINPLCKVRCIDDFLTLDNISIYLSESPKGTWIIDAMDDIRVKAGLIAWAKKNKVKIITSGAAGGKIDPLKLEISDLNFTYHDPLSARLREILKKEYHFPSKPKKMGVPIIFSSENIKNNQRGGNLNCSGYGSMMTVTGTMGIMMASYVINKLLA